MPLVGAIRALVLLDVVGSGGRDLHALPVVPLLAVIAADPELVLAVIVSAGSAQHSTGCCVAVLFRLLVLVVVTALFFISQQKPGLLPQIQKTRGESSEQVPGLDREFITSKKAAYSDEHSPSTRRNTDGDGVQEREAEISMVTRTLVMTATAADLERSVGVDRANRTVGATWVDLRRRW